MTRNDDLGDNASLTPNDRLGDVHASVRIPISFLRRMETSLREEGFIFMADQTKAFMPKPTRCTYVIEDERRCVLDYHHFGKHVMPIPEGQEL